MSTYFSSTTARANSNDATVNPVTAAWWNDLRTAGINLEALLTGLYLSGSTSFSISNNVTDQNITGLTLDGATYRSVLIKYTVYRLSTGASGVERVQTGIVSAHYGASRATKYQLSHLSQSSDAGFSFGINDTSGQVIYTSDNQAGTISTHKVTYSLEYHLL